MLNQNASCEARLSVWAANAGAGTLAGALATLTEGVLGAALSQLTVAGKGRLAVPGEVPAAAPRRATYPGHLAFEVG
ncbi:MULTISPECIES: hypothetical protein [unclassified Streptomyces]|uniref:hypothetical protein n=1 Tax=unclassified Streptomyces TaxID=2593676 RepID=UPI0029B104E5|nr:hypothetical protein [Streptomyces sp. DK15]MDX2389549.1 hypothetical protein [Streptomyces sp. DK15]